MNIYPGISEAIIRCDDLNRLKGLVDRFIDANNIYKWSFKIEKRFSFQRFRSTYVARIKKITV